MKLLKDKKPKANSEPFLEIVGFRLLVKPDDIEKERDIEGTEKKLVIITNDRYEKAAIQTGVVVGIGLQAWGGSTRWCEVGDRIMFSKYGGKWICDPSDETKEYIVLNDEDVLAKLPALTKVRG